MKPVKARAGLSLGVWACLISAGLILAVALGFLTWQQSVKRQLFAQVAVYRAAGEPVWPTDFVAAPIPDEQNAAIDLTRAAHSIDQSSEVYKRYDRLNLALPLTAEEQATVAAMIEQSRTALDGARTATTKPSVNWGAPLKSPLVLRLLPYLNNQRELANLLAADAYLKHQQGDDHLASDRIEQILFQSQALSQEHTLVDHLVSVGLAALATSRCEQIAPDLRIGNDPKAVTPPQLRKLIDRLLDDAIYAKGRRAGIIGERATALDTALCIVNGAISSPQAIGMPSVLGGPMRPMILVDARLMMVYETQMLAAAEKSADLPAFKRNSPPFPAEVSERPTKHMMAQIMLSSLDRAMATDYRLTTDRRLVATALAIRWYAVEHDGKLPATLDELAPKYLPAVPADPMADARPLRYVPGGSRPVLYSVGADGVDQHGSTQPVRGSRGGSWGTVDEVIDLKRQPRVFETDDQ